MVRARIFIQKEEELIGVPAGEKAKNPAVDPMVNDISLSRVTPKGILGREEEDLLGLPKEGVAPRVVSPQ